MCSLSLCLSESLPSSMNTHCGWPCGDTVRSWPCASLEEGPHQELNNLAPWSWTRSLQNSEKISFCCINHPVYGILLWQLEQTNTVLKDDSPPPPQVWPLKSQQKGLQQTGQFFYGSHQWLFRRAQSVKALKKKKNLWFIRYNLYLFSKFTFLSCMVLWILTNTNSCVTTTTIQTQKLPILPKKVPLAPSNPSPSPNLSPWQQLICSLGLLFVFSRIPSKWHTECSVLCLASSS